MNGLLKPSSGSITIGEKVIKSDEKNKGLKEVRQHVGLVFQFPEYQLFEVVGRCAVSQLQVF